MENRRCVVAVDRLTPNRMWHDAGQLVRRVVRSVRTLACQDTSHIGSVGGGCPQFAEENEQLCPRVMLPTSAWEE